MEIVPFREEYRQPFIDFNSAWIVDNFGTLEAPDLELFRSIEQLLEKGAMIYVALEKGEPVAVCMTLPRDETTWEICKLGSSKSLPHHGAGGALVEACMRWAFDHGAKRLFLVSNRKMEAALHIYRKCGFKEIPLEDCEYSRGDISMEFVREDPTARGVVHADERARRMFKGVSLDALAIGKKSQVTKMNYRTGDFADPHSHPNEQAGYVLSGRYRLTVEDRQYDLQAGDSYAIPANTEHSFEVLEEGQVIDFFTPARPDYL